MSRSEDSIYRPDDERDAYLAAARAGEVGQVTRTYRLPTIGDQTLPTVAERLEPFAIDGGLDETEEPAIPAADQEE